jgi:aspartate racemase
MKKILIIGGMGPQASLQLHRLILDEAARSGAKENHEYPQIFHISIPVRDFISNKQNQVSARTMLLESLGIFKKVAFDYVIIACNTAHMLVDDIYKTVGLRPLSLIDTTVESIVYQKLKKIGLLATPTTIKSSIYRDKLAGMGIDCLEPSRIAQDRTETMIRETIANSPLELNSQKLLKDIDTLIGRGAEKVILGCTELSVIAQQNSTDKILDPLRLIAQKIYQT